METKKFFLKDLEVGDYGIYHILNVLVFFCFSPQIYFNIFLSHHFPRRMVPWDAWVYVTFQNLKEGPAF